MTNQTVSLTIKFNDPQWDDEKREQEAQKLMSLLKQIDEVTVKRPYDLNIPQESKSLGAATLIGLLNAEVSLDNFKGLIRFLGDRLGNKSIELEVKVKDKYLKIVASSREEMQAAVQAAQAFVSEQTLP